MKSFGREQMRRLDEIATRKYRIPSILLMENAGLRAADEIFNILKSPAKQKAAIVCGKGNNGGDGFVIARHLHNKGVQTEVYLSGISLPLKTSPIPPDHIINLEIILAMGLKVMEIGKDISMGQLPMVLSASDILVDALLGTGLQGEVKHPVVDIIDIMNAVDVYKVAIDIPSGLDANTGLPLGHAVKAHKTITMGAMKNGFGLGDGPEYTGEVVVADISLPREMLVDDSSERQ